MYLTQENYYRWAEYVVIGIGGITAPIDYSNFAADVYRDEPKLSQSPEDWELEEMIEESVRVIHQTLPEVATVGRVKYGAHPSWHPHDKVESMCRFCECSKSTFYERLDKFHVLTSRYVTQRGF